MKKKLIISGLLLGVCAACIRDTDFDQVEDFVWQPISEVNFIYTTIHYGQMDSLPGNSDLLTVVDTTEIRFLDENFMQESLRRVDFYFKTTNGFTLPLEAHFQFLSEENEPFYEISFDIPLGNFENPVVSEHTQTILGEDITLFTQNDKVVLSFTTPAPQDSIPGTLNLQSKATFYIEYTP